MEVTNVLILNRKTSEVFAKIEVIRDFLNSLWL